MKLVIDTDIGTDVDDLFALTYAIKSGIEIKAITIVQGDTSIRAKIARKLERILEASIPITAGQRGPEKSVKKYWTGIEEKALTAEERNEIFVNSEFPEYNPETNLVCIGPLTNIAHQLRENPSIKNVQKIFLMGNHYDSHNFKSDLEAAKLVLSQPWTKFCISKEVSKKISFSRRELASLRGNELGNFLYESAIRWLDYSNREKAIMYDVLVISTALGEDFVKFHKNKNGFLSYCVDERLKEKIIEAVKNG